jgi:hypothetical protein
MISVPSSRVKKSFFWASWPWKIEKKCPKTLATNCLPKACNVPQAQNLNYIVEA